MDAYDCLERAWLNAQETVRDYEMYSKRIRVGEVSEVFKKYAEEAGMQASKFRELLIKYKDEPIGPDSAIHTDSENPTSH